MKIFLMALLVTIVLGMVFSVYSELEFAQQFEKRVAERERNGPIIDSASATDLNDSIAFLQKLYKGTLQAWCDGNGQAYGSAFDDNAEYIAFTGEVTRGRQEITAAHQVLFEKWLKGSCLVGTIETIRFLTPDVAVIVALGGTTFDGKNVLRRPSIQTYVALRKKNIWRFTNFQNSRVSEGSFLQLIVLGIRTSVFRM